MKRVVMFSSGTGSYGAAKRVAERHGTDGLTLLFTDTLIEDEDNYRFLHEAALDVGGELVIVADGRNPWQVFEDKRFLGNSRIDPCSQVLKREVSRKWLEANCDPADTTIYVGIDWTEEHRFVRLRDRWALQGWKYEAPLCEAPFVTKDQILEGLAERGIAPPRLYAMGFAHANCGGFCVKAGQGHFANLLQVMPERYAEHEREEELFRDFVGADVSIMNDRRGGGPRRPLTMKAFRERVQGGGDVDEFDIGGCNCFGGESD